MYTYESLSISTSIMAAPHVASGIILLPHDGLWIHCGDQCVVITRFVIITHWTFQLQLQLRCNEEYGYTIVDARAAYEWWKEYDYDTYLDCTTDGSRGGLLDTDCSSAKIGDKM
jgi:hypothetical protein